MTPVEPNTVLKRLESGEILANKDQSKYQSGIRNMMHMMRLCRLNIYNATHNCARQMMLAGRTHYYNVMVCIMDYCMITPERGLVLKLHSDWDGISTDYKFKVTVKTDSDYAKFPDTRGSVTESMVYLNGAPVMLRSSTQKLVSLSTTKQS